MGRVCAPPEYSDWLTRIDDIGGELKWISKRRHFPVNREINKSGHVRSTAELNRSVLNSVRVKQTVKEEATQRQCETSVVRKEAEEILSTMAHDVNMPSVRVIGYAVLKVIKRIFDGIFVNFDQLKKIRELCKTDSVVFIPTHKTYMDFLLLSLLCYDQDITLPAIAAGMDFMNSKFMGEALRRCGAFFIRRSFGSDRLYWAVFTEYVQTHLIHADRPLEFFVEGTRSRSGKSLHPKFGLLQTLLEPYLRGSVYDLKVIPVAINYDKILEELLYSYELLGFPKPKESTSGLFKARDILNHNYGKVYMTFCEPLSVRDYFGSQIKRSLFVCQPDSQFVVSEREKTAIRQFGHEVVRRHNDNSIISVWPFACIVMLQMIENCGRAVFSFSRLRDELERVLGIFRRLGVAIQIDNSLSDDLIYYINIHADLFDVMDTTAPEFEMRLLDQPVEKEGAISKHALEKAVGRLVLTNYANKMVHTCADTSLLSLILMATPCERDALFDKFSLLQLLMQREFVCMPEGERASFEAAVETLERAQIISCAGTSVEEKDEEAIDTLAGIIKPYVLNHAVVSLAILQHGAEFVTSASVVRDTQKLIACQFEQSVSVRLSFLSTDAIKNAYSTLVDRGALVKKADQYRVLHDKVQQVYSFLTQFTGQLDTLTSARAKL